MSDHRPAGDAASAAGRADTVLVRVDGAVGWITLNDPDRLNAVDEGMLRAVTTAMTSLDIDESVRVVALTGAGRGFCSGANLARGGEVDTGTLEAAGETVRSIAGARTPTVAVVGGAAAGVGLSLALACDYVLASDRAAFLLAFARIGLMPDGGATALVAANVGRARAMRMALTGEKVDAATAEAWGLVSEVVPADRIRERADAVLAALAATAPLASAETTAAINAATIDLDAALDLEERGQAMLLGTEDFREGVAAFFDKRPAVFGGR